MKIKSLFWGSLALLGLAVSCQEPVNSEPAVILTSDAVVNVGAEGADAVAITFTSATAWELRGLDDCDWLVADKMNGKGSADEQKLTLSISPNPEGNREISLTIYASPLAKKTVTVQQAGEKGDGVADITIAEFLGLKNTTQSYRLGGVIGDIARSTSYYGFTLKDETGEVSCPFPANWDSYSAALHTGDRVIVEGVYSYYESKNQDQVKNANILSHTPADASSVTSLTVSEFLAKADKFSRYRLTGTVSGTVNATYCSFDLKDETGTVKVYTVNNASEWGSKIAVGGKVTLVGAYTLYTNSNTGSSTPEVVDADIESFEGGSSETPAGDAIYSESFASGQGDWTIENKNLPEGLSAVWAYNEQYKCMLASGYSNNENFDSESWLISPVIDLAGQASAYLEFDQAVNFFSDIATAKKQAVVKIREENGSWTDLNIPQYPTALSWTFLNSGSIDIKAYAGKKIQIAFAYTSTSAKAGSWEVNNVKIVKEAAVVESFPADVTIVINDVTSSFVAATHDTYKDGFSMTKDGITIGYYKHASTSDAVAATDIVKVYKSSVLCIKTDRQLNAVRLTTSGSKYCVSMTPLVPTDLEVSVDSPYITIKGNANEYVLQASVAQVRFSTIEFDFAD
ncbi:MAG: OB-fold nucleic acid binding domain-containing protein [Bacteroidales bacterium]|nr:OB-fold nucleic acid binding domain-containing protein [Bacteroidales bacterium]